MDLSTTYLGLRLPNPLMPGASPMADHLDGVKRLEDAGAAAIVLRSLFEEQITLEQQGMIHQMEIHEEGFAEAISYFPKPDDFAFGPANYLEQIRKIKAAVHVPVIASLNGTSAEGWLDYSKQIQQAGADALELNIYFVPTDPKEAGEAIERRVLEIARVVKRAVTIPVAVKLSPFFSSVAHLAVQLDAIGVDGLVLFNRFYQPDIDTDRLEVTPNVLLSTPQDLRLPLRWIAILRGQVQADLAATSGIHTGTDVAKMLLAGATVTMVCSALLQRGIGHLKTVLDELNVWLEAKQYASLEQVRGSVSQARCANPTAFERANYMKALSTFKA